MATYFFVVITLIIIAILVFALSESNGRNSPNARGKLNNMPHNIETSTPSTTGPTALSTVQTNQ